MERQREGEGPLSLISTGKQAISIKLATKVGHFLHHLDFENGYLA